MQKGSVSELGFGIPSQASISSIKEDLRKDGIGRCVFRTRTYGWEGEVSC